MIISVRGIPAPQGSKRHVGGGRMVEMSKAVGPWREAVRAETQRAMKLLEALPLRYAIEAHITFGLPRPKGHWRTGRNAHLLRESAPEFPTGRPDLDKLARAVLDGLTAGGAWLDDSQVVTLVVGKVYCEDAGEFPGCQIMITEVCDA